MQAWWAEEDSEEKKEEKKIKILPFKKIWLVVYLCLCKEMLSNVILLTHQEDQTPLHIASRLGKTEIVQLLLQHMAHPDAATNNGYTPLHIAAREGHLDVASVLLEAGASHSLPTKVSDSQK